MGNTPEPSSNSEEQVHPLNEWWSTPLPSPIGPDRITNPYWWPIDLEFELKRIREYEKRVKETTEEGE